MAYAYSFNGTDYNDSGFDSIKEALEAAKEDASGYSENKPTKCFIGEEIKFKPEIDADWILDPLKENGADFAGEYADSYLQYVTDAEKKQLKEALQIVFDAWEERTKNKATFFQIDDSKEYSLEIREGEKTMEKQEDQCESCHNALQCLVWADEGVKAKCDNWSYFEQNYVNGPKRAMLEAELAEVKED